LWHAPRHAQNGISPGPTVDFVAIIFSIAIRILNLFPYEGRVWFMARLIGLVLRWSTRYRRVAMRNLSLVFPDRNDAELEAIYRRSITEFARLVVDLTRIPVLDNEWLRTNVSYERIDEYQALKAKYAGKGLVVATGHLGSFELLLHAAAAHGHRTNVVARPLKPLAMNELIDSTRKRRGAKVYPRNGAFKHMLRSVQGGEDIAILFDQNVTRNHAVFIPFFGRLAATTRSVALTAIRTATAVVVISIRYTGNGRYKIENEFLEFTDIYEDSSLSGDEKMLKVTERISATWEQFVRRQPEGWFWMHRRWKTTPEGVPEDFYD
jgi:Kdo2-lipid IVA lauroyltransferase/acyltransferase